MLKEILNIFPFIIWSTFAGISTIIAILIWPFLYVINGRILWQKFILYLADFCWFTIVWSVEKWGCSEIIFSGDPLPNRETAIVISNHIWLLDWIIIFSLASRKGRLGCCKFFAKESVKWIPGIGWGCWILDFVFLERNWANDYEKINKTFYNLKNRKLPFWLINHVEGTRISKNKLKESQEYCRKKELPILHHLLFPRTKGFKATVQAFKDSNIIDAIYDITLIYNDKKKFPSLADLVLRKGIKVHMHVRRYSFESIPNTDQELHQWLIERWKEKDNLIENFTKEGKFPNNLKEPFHHRTLKLFNYI